VVLKVKTDIITSIIESWTGRALKLVTDNVCRDLQNWQYCFYQ